MSFAENTTTLLTISSVISLEFKGEIYVWEIIKI